jgi:urease accessory protein
MMTDTNPTPTTFGANLGLLSLTQWLSPSFPLGAFAYSHALELAMSEGKVSDAETLKTWLSDTLAYGGGKVDAWLLAMALAGGDPTALADLAESLAATRERWMETSDQGTAFVRTVAQMGGPTIASCALPVAVGQAARALDVDAETVIALYLHSFTANLVSAAVRFVPLGQSAGQSVLARLHDQIAAQARAALGATQEGLTSSAFAADLGAAQHEDMDVRLFKS